MEVQTKANTLTTESLYRSMDVRIDLARFRGRLNVWLDVLLPVLLLPAILLMLLFLCGAARMDAQSAPVSSSPSPTLAPTQTQTTSTTTTTTTTATTPAIPLPAAPPNNVDLGKHAGKKTLISGGNVATVSLAAYLARVRAETVSVQPTSGAIWTDTGRLTRMNTDVRAMRPNDLISVVVSENLAATTTGKVNNSRASAANSGISGLIGTLHAGNALQNLITQSSSNSLGAQGESDTNSSLTTTFGGQVIDVLPNGMLVIEAARQVEFSQQTQTIILRGLVRPEDISQQNQVLSTAISSLELEVKGKGIVNDYTRRQNPLVRWLQQVLVF